MAIFGFSLAYSSDAKRIEVYHDGTPEGKKSTLETIRYLSATMSTEGRQCPYAVVGEKNNSILLQLSANQDPRKIKKLLAGFNLELTPVTKNTLSLPLSDITEKSTRLAANKKRV